MRRVVLSLLTVLVALLGAAWLVLGVQAKRLGEGLVADANTLEIRRFELAKTGTPGGILDCLGAQADVAPDLSRTLPWTLPEVMAVTNGTAPLSEPILLQLTASGAWLSNTLTCGRLHTVANAPGLGPFPDIRHGRRQSMPRLMESLTALAPLSMREALGRDAPDEALDTCASVLSLTTAWLRLEGLESMLPTLGPTRAVLPACNDALTRASEAARTRFKARIAEVRAVAPRYTEVMALERTQLGLRLFGAWLPGELDVQLPASAREVTKSQREGKFDRGVLATLALRLYWKRFDSGMREVERASTLQPTEREAAILAAQARLDSPFLKRFFPADPVDLRYQMYAVYLDQLHAQLDALSR